MVSAGMPCSVMTTDVSVRRVCGCRACVASFASSLTSNPCVLVTLIHGIGMNVRSLQQGAIIPAQAPNPITELFTVGVLRYSVELGRARASSQAVKEGVALGSWNVSASVELSKEVI